ncbi:MAG: metallophosphoesterase [Thermodesulfobacteriota bacterium]|nr:metallophosphoesterase [Thermodesulfobacteriota bacterium]
MSAIFFTADTHFGHTNIIKKELVARSFSCIEEHDQVLVDRWNSVVGKRDVVWHLGDVAWHASDLKTVERLNGTKKLVLGNHDHYPTIKYLKVFSKVYGFVDFKLKTVLSHCPIHPCEMDRFSMNLHGHLHSKVIDDSRYVNVGVDRWGLAPVSWELIKGKMDIQMEDG